MADVTIELLKTQLRQLRLPTMGREFERLAQRRRREQPDVRRVVAATDRGRAGLAIGQRGGHEDQERGIPRRKGLRHLRLQRDAEPVQAEDPRAGARRLDRSEIQLLPGGQPRNRERPIFRSSLGLAACRAGLRVRFFTAAELVNRLEKEQKQYTLDRFLGQLEKAHLLICDELGYVSMSRGGVETAVPGLRRSLRAWQPAGDDEPAVQRVGPDLPGRTDDGGPPRPALPPLPHFRDEWRELPIPRVDEDEEGPKG